MADRPVPPGHADSAARDVPTSARDDRASSSLPARIASAGSWVRDEERGRGWEDLLSEFLAAIAAWGGIGWLVDRWLDTGPWFLIAGLVLGNGLGIYLMWLRSDPDRATTRTDGAAGHGTRTTHDAQGGR